MFKYIETQEIAYYILNDSEIIPSFPNEIE